MQKITNFIKYNNAFILILGALFLVAGSSFASEKVRDTVIGQKIEEVKGVDNSALLSINLSSLKQEMRIVDVSEDEENYFVAYSFSVFDIKDNAWQNQTKNQTLKVPKEALNGGKDLGLYVQSELAQVADSHMAYLKDVQEKEQKKGQTKIIKTTKYTGLKGLVLNSETKELDGYEPVMKKMERVDPPYAPPAIVVSSSSSSSVKTSSSSAESSSSSSNSSSSSSSLESSSAQSSGEASSSAGGSSSSSDNYASSSNSSASSSGVESSVSSATTTEASSSSVAISSSSSSETVSSSGTTSSSSSEALSQSSSAESSSSTASSSESSASPVPESSSSSEAGSSSSANSSSSVSLETSSSSPSIVN